MLKNIIDDFDIERFTRFFRDKNRAFAPIKEKLDRYNDKNFIHGLKLGEIKFTDAEEMIICAFEVTQPLTERSGKKAQYEKAKKILKETQYDSGIFIFYDQKGNFRFSLIYANYLGRKRDWNNFRRFTYFVCKEFTNKTFLQRIGKGDFSTLEKIKDAFSVEKVTKQFYKDISYWYFWAIQNTEFPKDAKKEKNGRNIAIIRLITRLIFIWFMRERKLIPKNLFDYHKIKQILKDTSPEKTTYYKAILQNLFFATLNTKERKYRFQISGWKNSNYMDHSVYRYQDYFINSAEALKIFKEIPFLNGGLFDCLDRSSKQNNNQGEVRIDGFSDKEVGLKFPNFLFFSEETNADLNKDFGTKNKNYKVQGLINILSAYNFTIDENDPNDQEVALDPELLGKVFENLLASFNPETSSTARKATGSYYTPREIVDYMVMQSLKEYFKTHLKDIEELEKKLDELFAADNEN
ncbi:MAG: class I SAM-dependent DNA methyltransferase, partial [Candidatus Cloacimonetes bacterium]|nr:class I SAM-dependent DNA methyltransferase [Candidatus Cloacimonadota bacterium]